MRKGISQVTVQIGLDRHGQSSMGCYSRVAAPAQLFYRWFPHSAKQVGAPAVAGKMQVRILHGELFKGEYHGIA